MPPPVTSQPTVALQADPPRPGDLSPGWRIGTALTWIAVILALAAVWNSSVQLGLSTWWLGPRSQPQPLVVQLSPFAAPVLMVLATVNQVRRLPWFGLAASVVVVAIGVGDLWRVTSIAVIEILIGVAAAAISVASFTGTYRLAADAHPAAGEPTNTVAP
jgi:hypothetical protein